MIIDCISDLHGFYPKMQGGDLLIIGGDCTSNDKIQSWGQFFNWLDQQKYRKKVMIAGNHDNWCKNWALSGTFTNAEYEQIYPNEKPSVEYLCDSGLEFEGLKIWGSPWTSRFPGINPHCCAFTGENDHEISPKWELIPRNTDILITHSPPFNFLDETIDGKAVGSPTLLDWVGKWKPSVHVFGHIHESYGTHRHYFGRRNFGNKYGVTMINCSHVNERYQPVNKPIRIIREETGEFQVEGNGKD